MSLQVRSVLPATTNVISRASLALLCLQLVLAALPSMQASAQADVTLFQGARVIIGDGSVLEQGAILIREGEIEAVGSVSDIDAPGARIIDLQGKTVMPAMIDAHTHLGYQGASTWGAENYSRANLIDNLQRYAYYGFAAVFSAGSDPAELMQALQASEERGEFIGARPLYAAGMAPPGQGPNNQFLAQALAVEQSQGQRILYGLEDPGQARSAVRDAAQRGVRFLKIWVDDRGGSQQKLSPLIYGAVADEAALNNLKLFVHQQYASDMPGLLEAGVHGFLHGRFGADFDLDLARQTAAAGAFVIPNLGLGELRREAIGEDAFLLETHSEAVASSMTRGNGQRRPAGSVSSTTDEELSASLMTAVEAGVDIILGTDAGAVPEHPFGYTGHRELEIYVRLGMTPMQALVAATGKAAEHLGLTDMGMLAPGYSADLLILDGNPLRDIRETRKIHSVYLRGSLLPRESLAAGWREAD